MHEIIRVAVVGGPCAGKSTVMSYERQKLEEVGYAVFTVPEAATLCINGGIDPRNPLMESMTIQKAIMKTAFDLEQNFFEAATKIATQKPVVMLFDRGIPDASAYAETIIYEKILDSLALNPIIARDKRYDAVIHLRSVACDKPEYYTLANNTARYEDTIEKAVLQDEKTLNAWIGHPHLRIVDNSTDFEGKIKRVHQEICALLGIPVPIERESKFLVRFNKDDVPYNAQHLSIDQAYIKLSKDQEIRVRKRGRGDHFTYYQTIKRPGLNPGERFEAEHGIEESQYVFGLSLMEPGTGVVQKTRACFVHKNQYLELDTYKDPRVLENEADGLLEIESTRENPTIEIPEWMTVVKEVTDDPHYKNSYFARKIA